MRASSSTTTLVIIGFVCASSMAASILSAFTIEYPVNGSVLGSTS
jgi:hypothetical protein